MGGGGEVGILLVQMDFAGLRGRGGQHPVIFVHLKLIERQKGTGTPGEWTRAKVQYFPAQINQFLLYSFH